MTPPWRVVQGGVTLDLRVTPRSGRDSVGGIEELANGQTVLKVRVRALPTEGEANAAVIALVAKSLKLPKRDVMLERGGASRVKSLRLAGDATSIAAKLEMLAKAET